MAYIECTHVFQGIHRKPDEPFYDQAFTDLQSLHKDGIIDGSFRLSIGDRQGSPDVWVTIWRSGKTDTPEGLGVWLGGWRTRAPVYPRIQPCDHLARRNRLRVQAV